MVMRVIRVFISGVVRFLCSWCPERAVYLGLLNHLQYHDVKDLIILYRDHYVRVGNLNKTSNVCYFILLKDDSKYYTIFLLSIIVSNHIFPCGYEREGSLRSSICAAYVEYFLTYQPNNYHVPRHLTRSHHRSLIHRRWPRALPGGRRLNRPQLRSFPHATGLLRLQLKKHHPLWWRRQPLLPVQAPKRPQHPRHSGRPW